MINLKNQKTTKEKQSHNKPVVDNNFCMWMKDILHPFLNVLVNIKLHYNVLCEEQSGFEIIRNRTVIYAVNHYSFMDIPIICSIIPKRGYILAGTQKLSFSDWLYFILNGVIFVDRKDREDRSASKNAIITYLRKKRSVIMFPEGTWNLTDSQLMLPMKWGIIDIAMESGAQIIPMILDYDREKRQCLILYGTPLLFEIGTNRREAIRSLRDAMATMRWKLWERKPGVSRCQLNVEEERKKIYQSVKEYPNIDIEYENSCIYHL